jgi:hypothetical protein
MHGPERPDSRAAPRGRVGLIAVLLIVIAILALALAVLIYIDFSGFTMDH